MQITARKIPEGAKASLISEGMSPEMAKLFAARGITRRAQLETSFAHLHSFEELKDAKKMACLLADAIASQKKLLIVADYDCDGATACAVAMKGLGAFGARVDFIVPNRFEYGYGLTPEIVHLAASKQPDILVTVDNGIASVEGVLEAHRLGMQILVTDHHLPGDSLPDATCIVNPNQPGCTFPSKNLAGVGVIFYVLLALRAELRNRGQMTEDKARALVDLLDLVALGTIADVVRLDQNNRILVQQGLLRIRAGRTCAGINALIQVSRKNPARLTSQDLGFAIGPRLNAAGRLEDMGLGIECLITQDADIALQIATRLDGLNHERRSIESQMQDSALIALESVKPHDNFSLTLFDETWHQGVIGILASRLKDKFHRPVIAFAAAAAGEIKGSGRSITGLHLRDALDLVSKRHPKLIRKFGGHAAAAGLSIAKKDLSEFSAAFEQVARELLSPDDLSMRIETDGGLDSTAMTLGTAEQIDEQVWGQGFPIPQFDDTFLVLSQRIVGEKHLKLRLSGKGAEIDAILFGRNEPLPERCRIVYSLGVNEYNGKQSLQLIVRHWEAEPEVA